MFTPEMYHGDPRCGTGVWKSFNRESESESFITIIVCLVEILLSVLDTALWRKYSQNKYSKFQKPLEAVETWS